MNILDKQKELIEDFALFDDWEQKYEYLISLGKTLNSMDESKKTKENLIAGCQSRVWIFGEKKEGKLFFEADSEGILPKGMIAILVNLYNGFTPNEILESNLDFISEIGLQEFLSPSRANGLAAMLKQIKLYALHQFMEK